MKTFRKPLAALLLTTKNAYGMKRLNCFIMKATAYLGHGQSYLLREVDWCYRVMSRKILSSLWHDTYADCPSSAAFVHNSGNGLQDPEVHLWYTLHVNSLSLCVYISALWSLQCLFWFECTFLYWYKQGIGIAKTNLECGCLKCIRSWSIKSPFSSPKHIWYVRCTQVMFTSLLLIFDMLNIYCTFELSYTFSIQQTLQMCWGCICPVETMFCRPLSRRFLFLSDNFSVSPRCNLRVSCWSLQNQYQPDAHMS